MSSQQNSRLKERANQPKHEWNERSRESWRLLPIIGECSNGDDPVGSSLAAKASTHPAHAHKISLRIHDLTQLFNSMDPSPFIEKDLDEKAEAFIVGWAQEFPADARIKLRVHLEQWPTEGDPKELIRQAVHNHFAHLAELNRLEFRALMKQGRTSLLIGLLCLAVSLVASKIMPQGEAGTWAGILRESLTIAGWVAMWRPMQIYLYDWWPLRRRGRLCEKLSRMPVEVIRKSARTEEVRSERLRLLRETLPLL